MIESITALLVAFSKYILVVPFLFFLGLGVLIGTRWYKNPQRSLSVSIWGVKIAIGEDKK